MGQGFLPGIFRLLLRLRRDGASAPDPRSRVMSKFTWLVLSASLSLLMPAGLPAQPPNDVKPLLEKVLNAYGGEQKLNQIKAVSFTRKTTLTKDGKVSIQKVTIQLPDQLRS